MKAVNDFIGIVDDTAYTPLSAANDSPKQSGDSSSQPIEIEDSLARAAAAHNDSVIYVDRFVRTFLFFLERMIMYSDYYELHFEVWICRR